MDYHLDHQIRLTEEEEYKSLYRWSLQEFKQNGEPFDSKHIPWGWNLYFTARNVLYRHSFSLVSDESEKPQEESEWISAELHSDESTPRSRRWPTSFSMFGTNRTIRSLGLQVRKLDDDSEAERCEAWGCVSYTTEIDFRDETEDDTVLFTVWLSAKRFDALRELVRSKSLGTLHVRLGRVSGFYSPWSPSISTSHVKVLAPGDEQKVSIPEGCERVPPRLGPVGEVNLSVVCKAGRDTEPVDEEKPEPADESSVPDEDQPPVERSDAQLELYKALLDRMSVAERSIRRLSVPIWIVAILVLLGLLLR